MNNERPAHHGNSPAVCQANHKIHSPPPCLWMRCHTHRTAGTGRNWTQHNKNPSAICTADISHTSERA